MDKLHLLSPAGFRAGAYAAGIKASGKLDVAMLVCDRPAAAAAVFTINRVVSAGVVVGRRNIAAGKLRGIVVNSGNANACTGKQGMRDAERMCQLAAKEIGCPTAQILPSSTGIIGHLLPMEKIQRGVAGAASDLGKSAAHAQRFSDAILTTDLVRKTAAARIKIGGQNLVVAGVCKGSGMIGPRLALQPPHATMLAYLSTDAKISPVVLRRLLAASADKSFNAVTVDDHPSTNDTAAILASGLGPAVSSQREVKLFSAALDEVCQSLAYQIAADGEGATKVVRIDVSGARSESDARKIARAIANSPLVKCAMHGNDPNWGRIISIAGICDADFDADRSVLKLQGTTVFRHGRPMPFDAAAVSRALARKEVLVDLSCGLGKSSATVWTCDLSKEYVTINADYHT
ncbi:MAG: bifunctional glutamate N-acetyltransferase/amino-acid acetyltransferase ArgJ [Tepidisphaeraceae bacterium]|jgi:glutamate N-acetyltransferase/amino-acid N-acetyltransferase